MVIPAKRKSGRPAKTSIHGSTEDGGLPARGSQKDRMAETARMALPANIEAIMSGGRNVKDADAANADYISHTVYEPGEMDTGSRFTTPESWREARQKQILARPKRHFPVSGFKKFQEELLALQDKSTATQVEQSSDFDLTPEPGSGEVLKKMLPRKMC